MPMLGAWVGAQGSSHADMQTVVVSRFLDQGGELLFPFRRIDSYLDFFHTVATSHVLVARAPALYSQQASFSMLSKMSHLRLRPSPCTCLNEYSRSTIPALY